MNYNAGAWYAALSDKTPYIQVNLRQRINVTGLATQASTSGQYVTQYRVSYSVDGMVWRNYTENGVTKLFTGNSHGHNTQTHHFRHVIVTQYIRVHPTKWAGLYCALRMELYGCSNQSYNVPGKPVNLRATSISTTSITVVWTKPRDGNPTSYLVWYRARGSATSALKVVTRTQINLRFLLPYTVYDIKVQAWNHKNGKGPWSSYLQIKTVESVPDVAPGNVKVKSKAPLSLDVTWQQIPRSHYNGVFQGYVVFYQKLGAAAWSTIKVSPMTLAVLLPSLEAAEYYNVKVAGYTRVGTGKESAVISTAVMDGAPSPPRNLQALAIGAFSVNLTWERPLVQNGDVRHYIVKYGESQDKLLNHKIVPYSSASRIWYTLTGLRPETTYFILVYAETSIRGQRSIIATVRTFSDGPKPTTRLVSTQGTTKSSSTVPPIIPKSVSTKSNKVKTDFKIVTELNSKDETTTSTSKSELDSKDETTTSISKSESPSIGGVAAVQDKKEEKEDDIFKMLLMTGVPAFVALVFLVCLIAVVACRRKKRKATNGELAMEMHERVNRNGVTRGRGSTRYSAPTTSECNDGHKRCSCQSANEQTLTRGNEYVRAPQAAECDPLVEYEDKSHKLDSDNRVTSEEHIYAAVSPVGSDPKQKGAATKTNHCYANQSEIAAASRPHVYEYLDLHLKGPAYMNLPSATSSNQASATEGPSTASPPEVPGPTLPADEEPGPSSRSEKPGTSAVPV